MDLAALQVGDTGRTTVLLQYLCRQRASLDLQVLALHRWPQIGGCCRTAAALRDRHLQAAEALLHRAIIIVGLRISGLPAGGCERVDQFVLVTAELGAQGTAAATILAVAALPML